MLARPRGDRPGRITGKLGSLTGRRSMRSETHAGRALLDVRRLAAIDNVRTPRQHCLCYLVHISLASA
jgi:hypothetical protein